MSDEHYVLEVNQPMGWVTLCHFSKDHLDSAVAYCRLYTMSEKSAVRLREDQNIVYEAFYDHRLDPDARDWDDGREDFDISWQECGF